MNYKVSVPLFVCPFVNVDANNINEAKSKALEMMESAIRGSFDEVDVRVLEDDGWEIKPTIDLNKQALALLKEHGIDTKYFKGATIGDNRKVNGYDIDLVYLDFDYKLDGANLSYLLVNNEVYFLADGGQYGYPADIDTIRYYPWTSSEGHHILFTENYDMYYLASDWFYSVEYRRLLKLKAILCRPIIITSIDDLWSMKFKIDDSMSDKSKTYYLASYSNDNDVLPKCIEEMSVIYRNGKLI